METYTKKQYQANPTHTIQITSGSELSRVLGTTTPVNSYHHQAEETVAADLSVRSTDGVMKRSSLNLKIKAWLPYNGIWALMKIANSIARLFVLCRTRESLVTKCIIKTTNSQTFSFVVSFIFISLPHWSRKVFVWNVKSCFIYTC